MYKLIKEVKDDSGVVLIPSQIKKLLIMDLYFSTKMINLARVINIENG